MRIIRNDKFVQSRAKLGRFVSLAGLAVLALGLIISFGKPELFYISFLCLLVGFLCSQLGIYLGNRYIRIDRPDEVLAKALKGFDDRYALYQYTSPAGNVLVTPNACLVFTVKPQAGSIEYRDGKWRHHTGGLRRFFGWMTQEGLGNPIRDAQAEAGALQRFLSKKLPGVDVSIQPVIVFGSPNAEVSATDSPIPAVHAKKLKEWLRGHNKAGNLSADAHTQLAALFETQDTTNKPAPSSDSEE
jgi:hypothetical protein